MLACVWLCVRPGWEGMDIAWNKSLSSAWGVEGRTVMHP